MKIEQSVIINRPVAEVFAFLTDFNRLSKWVDSLVESKALSDGPMRTGFTFKTVSKMMGNQVESTGEVTEFIPNQRITYRTISGPVPSVSHYTFMKVQGGTQLIQEVDANVGGVFKLAEGLLASTARKQLTNDLKNLKNLLEAGITVR